MASSLGGRQFDVIVVGGGPAGSMTAYFLAKSGIRTALLDASTFPRTKACGGGLQARTLLDIPFDLSHLFRGTMYRMSLSFGLREFWTRGYPEPLVYSVLRSEFDHYLVQCARTAGACVYEASLVRGVTVTDGAVTVRTDGEEFHAQLLVGADGANSVVRSTLNSRQSYFWQAAVYCEIPEEYVNPEAFSADAMRVDFGTLPSGYAWVFPKLGSVNVGAGAPVTMARHLRKYVGEFIDNARLLKESCKDRINFVGHQLPTLTAGVRLSARRMLLVGDAAGVVEPFTGDGISFACKSARIAADSIFRALNSADLDLTRYHDQLLSLMGAELLWSRKLLAISVAFPKLIYRLFRSNDLVWQTFCKTLRGEESFHRLKKDVLGPFEFAWKAIDLFTQVRERMILSSKSLAFHVPKV